MKILVFAGFSKSLVHFRKDLLSAMGKEGHKVVALGPEAGYEKELAEIGVRFIKLPFNRLSLNPISDLKLLVQLIRILRKEKPDLYFGYTIKPVIYGSIAAILSGVRQRYAMVTGLGSLFTGDLRKRKLIRFLGKGLYKISFCCCSKVFFQNEDDIRDMTRMRLLIKEKCLLVNGSGINLEYYAPSPMPQKNIFLFVGSLLGDKGIREYMEAASRAKAADPSICCFIVGPLDQRVSAIKAWELEYYTGNKSVRYYGEVQDVRPYLDCCRYYVLPSYREGTPRSVLEAMAKGRPIITTDAPGCRETVIDGVNGFLVPVGNIELLTEKMLWLVQHPKEAEEMGRQSLLIVREKYDVNQVNRTMLEKMNLLKPGSDTDGSI